MALDGPRVCHILQMELPGGGTLQMEVPWVGAAVLMLRAGRSDLLTFPTFVVRHNIH